MMATPPVSPRLARRRRNSVSMSPGQNRQNRRDRSRDNKSRNTSLIEARRDVWNFLIRGVYTEEEFMSIRIPRRISRDLEDTINEDEVRVATEQFIDSTISAHNHYCFSSEDIVESIERNMRTVDGERTVLSKDVVMDALNKLYMLFGGDAFKSFSFPLISALSMVRFPTLSGVAIVHAGRRYVNALSMVVVSMERYMSELVPRDRVLWVYSQISNRIRSLQAMRLHAFSMKSHSRLRVETPYLHLSNGTIRDTRAVHAIPANILETGLTLIYDTFARMGLKLMGEDVYKPIVVDGVFLNAYEKFVIMENGKELSDLASVLKRLPGGSQLDPDWGKYIRDIGT